tara:strand:+ start:110 stop:406 length:297 start_codon:yes stop_codon:yes gene_type:complete
MNTQVADPFHELRTDGKLALFVNSEQPPDEEHPLDVYSYREEGQNKFCFFRLYKVVYVQDGQISHSLLAWRNIKVKKHCHAAMKQLIDSMRGMEEFLE